MVKKSLNYRSKVSQTQRAVIRQAPHVTTFKRIILVYFNEGLVVVLSITPVSDNVVTVNPF